MFSARHRSALPQTRLGHQDLMARAGRWLSGSWPGSCEVCRGWSASSVCVPCLALFSNVRPRCLRCAEPVAPEAGESTGQICKSCHRLTPPFDRVLVAFDYAFPWDGLIQQLKFADRTDLARPLADALAARVRLSRAGLAVGDLPDSGGVPLLLPMPLSPARLAERGYNQALLLACHLSRGLGLPMEEGALLRPIDALHQAELPREQRIKNLRWVFMVDPAARLRLQGRRVALVDDVVTTGSTAAEATRELLRAGVQAVEVWAVARTAAR